MEEIVIYSSSLDSKVRRVSRFEVIQVQEKKKVSCWPARTSIISILSHAYIFLPPVAVWASTRELGSGVSSRDILRLRQDMLVQGSQ